MIRPSQLVRAVHVALVALCCLAGCGGSAGKDAAPESPKPAEPRRIPISVEYGKTSAQTLAEGECHVLELDLDADRFVEVSLVQRGLDLYTTVTPPSGEEDLSFDSPTSLFGLEMAVFVTQESGSYTVEICRGLKEAVPASYDLLVAPPKAPSEADRALARGLRRYSDAEGSAQGGDLETAVATFEEALGGFEEAGARRPQAWAQFRLGQLEEQRGAFEVAEVHFSAAAQAYRELDDPRQEASALSYVGRVRSSRGDFEGAREAHAASVEAAERSGRQELLLVPLANLGAVYEHLGQTLQALEVYQRRRALAAEVHEAHAEWEALTRIGKVYRTSGDDQRAQQIFEEALAFARHHDLDSGVTESLVDLGRVHLDREEADVALPYFQEALGRKTTPGPDMEVAQILNNLGRCYWRLGDRAKSLDFYRRAVAEIPPGEREAPTEEGQILINAGWVHLLERDYSAAAESCGRALSLLRAADRPRQLTGALKCVAEVAVARGELERAASDLEEVLDIVETLRSRSAVQDLRASFVEDSYSYYERYVDVLLRLHERHPDGGYASRAFEAAERAKARILLDNLSEAESDIRAAADPELVAKLDELESEMSGLERALLGEGSEKLGEAAIRSLQGRLRELEAEHDLTTARIFADYPGWSTLLDSKPVPLEEVQRVLLGDGETQLVSFLLGEERSFAWIVGRDSVTVEVLPGRERIDRLARDAVGQLARRNEPHLKVRAELVAEAISQEVLAPVVPHLHARKLILIKDGALHYVPFAALPVPSPEGEEDAGEELLIDRYELVDVPSASAAVTLRRRRSSGWPADAQVAILADPVFQRDDERLGGVHTPAVVPASNGGFRDPGLTSTTRAAGLGRLERLEGSREEARRVSSLVPADQRLVALGFDATRDLLLSGRLSRYRILHLAGHGLVFPALTGLVLSLYDHQGRPVDGLVRPYELYGTRLSAELVVLSACKTGLGDEVRGEGLLGLSRGFLYAGASQVLASLWDVDDDATAVLMERFYRALLLDGDPPARALRRAQLSVRQEPDWAAPHYWAGFVLQGDGT